MKLIYIKSTLKRMFAALKNSNNHMFFPFFSNIPKLLAVCSVWSISMTVLDLFQ